MGIIILKREAHVVIILLLLYHKTDDIGDKIGFLAEFIAVPSTCLTLDSRALIENGCFVCRWAGGRLVKLPGWCIGAA